MMSQQSLIGELEDAIQSGSKDKRVDSLRRITDLFVADSDRLTDRQIDVFDDVLNYLIKSMEAKALAELSRRLAPIRNAPIEVVRRLAHDDNITVAEPVLTQSSRLTDLDLIDIAGSKTQGHLLAIAARRQIGSTVTDVLLRRGDQSVFHKLAGNAGASFSEDGFATLVKHAERDQRLAEKVGIRLDIPLKLFRELLLRASEAVRSHLLASAGPESRDKIHSVLSAIAAEAQHEAGFKNERDYAEAHARMLAMRNQGKLDEVLVYQLAKADRYTDMVAALALLCGAPVALTENLLQSERPEAWLTPCKVAGLEWPTVLTILGCRSLRRAMSEHALEAARGDFLKMSQSSAARVLRFWQVRQAAFKTTAPPEAPNKASTTGGLQIVR